MKPSFFLTSNCLKFLLSVIVITCSAHVKGQEITMYSYRYVGPDKADEFVKRETTYWSKVARKAITNGKLSFWGLFEKVGGNDLQNSPNYLFVNTYTNIDSAGAVWNAAPVHPNVPMAKMETWSFSKATSDLFLRDQNWEEAANVNPEKDFKYVVIVYHNTPNPDSFITLEKKHWAPFIKGAMDKKQTTVKGWGNASILAPTGNNMPFNSISFDLFPTLKDALLQPWAPDIVFPAGLSELGKLETTQPMREIYRIVQVENKVTVK